MNSKNTLDRDDKIGFYEKQLIDAFANLTSYSYNDRKSRYAVILGYLLIRRHLTQKQLRDLTGFSVGTIHNCLTMLEMSNRISKRLIPGTRTYEHFVLDNMEVMIAKVRYAYQEKLKETIIFYEILSQKVPHDHLLYSRIQDNLLYYKNVKDIIHYFNTDPNSVPPPINDDSQQTKQHLEKLFSKNMTVEDIEREIINLNTSLTNFYLFHDFSQPMKMILGYLITRKTLTQKELQSLTKLSVGAISQSLNSLVKYGIISLGKKTPKGHKQYQLLSINDSILKGLALDAETIISREQDFLKYKGEIEAELASVTNAQQNKELKTAIQRYNSLLTLIDSFLKMFAIYKRMRDKIYELMNKSH
ncbi:MAG: MarR family transcriptional regulator [Promethearchaeota archaeon]